MHLPLLTLADETETPILEPTETPPPFPVAPGDGASRVREVRVDQVTGRHEIVDRQADVRTIPGTGVQYSETGSDLYSVVEGEPLSALVRCERTTSSKSEGLSWSVNVVSEMTCDETSFRVAEEYSAHEGEKLVFSRSREHTIPRDHV